MLAISSFTSNILSFLYSHEYKILTINRRAQAKTSDLPEPTKNKQHIMNPQQQNQVVAGRKSTNPNGVQYIITKSYGIVPVYS
jgi:hypothetical protein